MAYYNTNAMFPSVLIAVLLMNTIMLFLQLWIHRWKVVSLFATKVSFFPFGTVNYQIWSRLPWLPVALVW